MTRRRKPDFELPSAEGEAGYPSDMTPMPRAEIPESAIEAVMAEWVRCLNAPEGELYAERQGDEAREHLIARRMVEVARSVLYAHWLEQLKEELLSDAAIKRSAPRFMPPGVTFLFQQRIESEIRSHVEAVLASIPIIPIEEGGDGD